MTDRITPELIKDAHDTLENHLAEPNENWLGTLSKQQWEYIISILSDPRPTWGDMKTADMITWLDNAPFLMGKLTDQDKAIREKIIALLSATPMLAEGHDERDAPTNREPKQYRCEGCGRFFDEKIFSHARAVDDGKGNPIPVECGPISEYCPPPAPAPKTVTRKEIKEWARTMTNVGDHYKNLTSDQFIAASEGNENYLTDKLREKGLRVEDKSEGE